MGSPGLTPDAAPSVGAASPSTDISINVTTRFVETVDVPIAPVVTQIAIPAEWFREDVRADAG